MGFKIGDRVYCTIPVGFKDLIQEGYGTVRIVGDAIGVEFDEYIRGHSLDNLCPSGYGWNILPSNLRLVEESTPISKEDFLSIFD